MVEEYNVFKKEYSVKSSTGLESKPTEIEKEEEERNQTVTGQLGYYDRLKPYRYFIRAKVVK